LIRLAHIINPVKVNDRADLYKTQPITFSSILAAKAFTKSEINVNLFATCFRNETDIVPDGFNLLSPLESSIQDIYSNSYLPQLPFIDEILAKVAETEADYIVYSNADIALMPYFYDAVACYINRGHDAISINRRRLSHVYLNQPELPLLFADIGFSHPGFDCFVFKKELISHFILNKLCLGIPFVEVALVHNMAAFATNPLYLTKAHLTFHIGAEVMPERNKQLYRYNKSVFFNAVYPPLKPKLTLKKLPYYSLPLHKRAIKWMLNPSLFTLNYLRLEGLSMLQKIKYIVDEVRWRILER